MFLDQEVNNTPMPTKKGILGGHFHLNFGMIQSTATCKMPQADHSMCSWFNIENV